MSDLPGIEDVLEFWFGSLDASGQSDADHRARWWKKDKAFDQQIRDRFGALHAEAANGGCRDWLKTARGRLAYVIVLDQFSRNMYRDSPAMYLCDALALHVALEAVDAGDDRELRCDERTFLYMPLMHSELCAVQERCVELFTSFAGELDGDQAKKIAKNADYAEQHRKIVDEYGRFPHRNAILGRASTEEEEAFLNKPGSSF